tara:strand:- start:6450 stop:8318 length:1869 start_codon:yes stop_codon:yes gene_type:complete
MASEKDRAAIRQAYLDYLGRAASEAEVDAYLANSIDVAADIEDIAGSPEAQDYRSVNDRSAIAQAYVDYLGREASDGEIDAYLANSIGVRADIQDIAGSREAQDWARRSDPAGTMGDIVPSGSQQSGGNTGPYDGGFTGDPGDSQEGPSVPPPRNVPTKPVVVAPTTTPTPPTPPAPQTQAPGGYDQTKWEDTAHDSMKYKAGRLLAGLSRPSEIQAMVESAEFQQAFPGATFDGKDKINFNGIPSDGVPVYEVDVLAGADRGSDSSSGFQWVADNYAANPALPTSGVSSPDPGGNIPDTGVSGDDLSGGGDVAGSGQVNPLAPATLAPPPNTFGMGPGGGVGTMGQMITPYNPLATYSPVPYVAPDPYRPPAYAAATPYQPGVYDAAVPFSREEYVAATPFAAPTAADMAADPSYQFRLQQGQDALERSGAARGVTNTGGTLKDILDYGQNAASQEYGNVYARMRDTYDANERNRFNAYQANYGNAMDAYGMNERNRFGAFDTNERNRAGAYNTNEANRFGAFNTNIRNAETAYDRNERNRFNTYTTNQMARLNENQTAENRRAGAYNTNLNAYQNQQNYGLRAQGQQFDQGFRNWQQQWNQQRMNQLDRFNQMYQLGGAQ